jgi:hypothetical protein
LQPASPTGAAPPALCVPKSESWRISTTRAASTTSKSSTDPPHQDPSPSFSINIVPAVAWIGLVTWLFTGAPGQFGDPHDAALLQRILADPVHPQINELFFTIFNLFAVMPVILAAVALPQAPRRGLPPTPFLLLSVAVGYFAAGPYFAFRPPLPVQRTDGDNELGWFTRNVLENRVVGIGTFVSTVFFFYAGNVGGVLQQGGGDSLWQDFVTLLQTSMFANVACLDLTLLHCTITALIPKDYALRNPDADPRDALRIAAATAFFPFLGSSLYLALRPSLPETE